MKYGVIIGKLVFSILLVYVMYSSDGNTYDITMWESETIAKAIMFIIGGWAFFCICMSGGSDNVHYSGYSNDSESNDCNCDCNDNSDCSCE